jgi:hypothetical protein
VREGVDSGDEAYDEENEKERWGWGCGLGEVFGLIRAPSFRLGGLVVGVERAFDLDFEIEEGIDAEGGGGYLRA